MRAFIALMIAGSLTLAACGSSHHLAARKSPPAPSRTVSSPVGTSSASPTPSLSVTSTAGTKPASGRPLIPNTAIDRLVCEQFAREQAGQITADQFNIWLLQNGNPASGKLITKLSDWFISRNMQPQLTEGYVAQVFAYCASIQVLV